ncbi:hypothetical protein DOT37_08260 [Pantoea agglomerans]|nr:hypothetical protein DOT37_08260 [Pantoea agglomerans]
MSARSKAKPVCSFPAFSGLSTVSPGDKPTGRGFPEASAALRNNRKPGADRTSAKGRHEPGMASPDGPSAAGRDEGTPLRGARRQPDAGIVKGRAYAP